ncbi:hypothetical protein N7513_012865 [Penicillium frequentans]|nr:hypothetical protein N7513_012865 [Penicillium glabrum]
MSLVKLHNHWPGGLSSYIHRSEEPVDDFQLATRGWRHFVREQWTTGDDEDQRRRTLVGGWATANQDFRDIFSRQMVGVVCICISEWTPMTQALLVKCLLSIFNREGTHEYLIESITALIPTYRDDITSGFGFLENFKLRASLARPNFFDMHMAQDGTVLFEDSFPKLIIDDQRVYRARMGMEEFPDLFRQIQRNSYPLYDVLLYMEDDEKCQAPEGILENESREWVCKQLDRYAPGYREAEQEGNGLAVGYDLQRLLINDGGPLEIVEERKAYRGRFSTD